MGIRIATWNINSVRLRINLVEKLLIEQKPDILCLQETKCPQGQFPSKSLKELGYHYIAEFGQKGYHGVAIVSRLPFTDQHSRDFCNKCDCRHVSVRFGGKTPFTLHNLYIPAGGDEPDITINDKFAHKLDFFDELINWCSAGAIPQGEDAIMVGDLNVAPLVEDVWSHKALLKVVSHTPIEVDKFTAMMKAGNWVDVMRKFIAPTEKLYTWWSYRAKDWEQANKGRRLDHINATPNLAAKATAMTVLKETRGWERSSDHVPVMIDFEI